MLKFKRLAIIISAVVFSVIFALDAEAVVTGPCSNCHSMHNSQGGSGDASGPNQNLLKNISGNVDVCVGCHSSTGPETIKPLNGSNIPIVFNTGAYPVKPLAGGNFYYVSKNTPEYDQYGHNVYGISNRDSNLNQAPGTLDACGTDECHSTLASSSNSKGKPGCQSCHQRLFHHVESNEMSTNTGYRFLWGHTLDAGEYVAYVEGVEDVDWEHSKGPDDHNYYKGTTAEYSSGGAGLKNNHTITAFCSGCHVKFHGPYAVLNAVDGMGSSSPWVRHPTDIALPVDGEYGDYDPVTNYSAEAPVAWVNPLSPSRDSAVVMCLSCHRPHGSDQPDMLRWDYGNMIAGGGPNTTGCFTCHSTKDTGL